MKWRRRKSQSYDSMCDVIIVCSTFVKMLNLTLRLSDVCNFESSRFAIVIRHLSHL